MKNKWIKVNKCVVVWLLHTQKYLSWQKQTSKQKKQNLETPETYTKNKNSTLFTTHN